MGLSVFLRFFGGVESDGFDSIPLIPLGCWLLPIGIFLLVTGTYLEKKRTTELFSCYRYRSANYWWSERFIMGLLQSVGIAILIMIVVLLFDVLRNTLPENLSIIAKVCALWFVHMLSMCALFLVLDLTNFRRLVPGALIVAETITFVVGFKTHSLAGFMFGIWGMYYQSSWYDAQYGFSIPVTILIELSVLLLCYTTGMLILKHRDVYEFIGKEVA